MIYSVRSLIVRAAHIDEYCFKTLLLTCLLLRYFLVNLNVLTNLNRCFQIHHVRIASVPHFPLSFELRETWKAKNNAEVFSSFA